jgi:mono/diheme cytochrome c family protein
MMRKVLKVLAITLAVLLLVGAGVGGMTYVRSNAAIARTYAIDQPAVPIPTDAASVLRGRHLVEGVMSCAECHGEDLGGTLLMDARPFMRLAAPNLTAGSGGVAPRLRDADWVRAIRHGVGHDGRALAVMPSAAYQHLSDADLGAAIAYLKNMAPVNRSLPARAFGPIARIQLAQGKFPLFRGDDVDHAAARSVAAPPKGVTVEYGQYLANIAGCTDCHGPGLSGGPVIGGPPDAPPASNLTPSGIGRWTEADFARALREGKGGGGRQLHPLMPYRTLHLTDDELRAIWMFVRSVQPKPFRNR